MFSIFREDEEQDQQTQDPEESTADRFRGALDSFRKKVKTIWPGSGVDEETLDQLEAAMLQSDVSLETVESLLEPLRENPDIEDGAGYLRSRIIEIFESAGDAQLREADSPPTVYFFIGVNGSGKTTTMAKMAHLLMPEHEVLFAAGDTYRAAAIEQLQEWAERLGVEMVSHKQGSDPSAVVYDALDAAISRNVDYLFVDTAGRLHTRTDLMQQLQKMIGVAEKKKDGAPHESLLVLDASTGQNGLHQVKTFAENLPVTGLVLTKLDSTARGGIALSVADELQVPVKLVGTGEELDDLTPFLPEIFCNALLEETRGAVG